MCGHTGTACGSENGRSRNAHHTAGLTHSGPCGIFAGGRFRFLGRRWPNKIIVLPGKYLVTLSFSSAAGSTGYVDLQPGHTYQVLNDIFSGVNKAFVWMEDADTGEVLLGEKM